MCGWVCVLAGSINTGLFSDGWMDGWLSESHWWCSVKCVPPRAAFQQALQPNKHGTYWMDGQTWYAPMHGTSDGVPKVYTQSSPVRRPVCTVVGYGTAARIRIGVPAYTYLVHRNSYSVWKMGEGSAVDGQYVAWKVPCQGR